MIDTAVLLGAGYGSRLRPFTDDRPKCVVELAGEPLAARVLRQLGARGVRRAVVVVGHQAARAREILGPRVGDVALTYVENAEYATTNTMYSTYLAIDALARGGYLIEGDVACSDGAIARLAAADEGRSHWAVEPWTPAHSGCRLTDDGAGRIVKQEIWRKATEGSAARLWKSGGMLKLSATGAQALAEALLEGVRAGNKNVYYDDIIGARLEAGDARIDLRVLDLSPEPWVEIDDPTDLAQARRLFEEHP